MLINTHSYLEDPARLKEILEKSLYDSAVLAIQLDDVFGSLETQEQFKQLLSSIKDTLIQMPFVGIVISSPAPSKLALAFYSENNNNNSLQYFQSFFNQINLKSLTIREVSPKQATTNLAQLPSVSLSKFYSDFIEWICGIAGSTRSIQELDFNVNCNFITPNNSKSLSSLSSSSSSQYCCTKLTITIDRQSDFETILHNFPQQCLKSLHVRIKESPPLLMHKTFTSMLTYILSNQQASLSELILSNTYDDLLLPPSMKQAQPQQAAVSTSQMMTLKRILSSSQSSGAQTASSNLSIAAGTNEYMIPLSLESVENEKRKSSEAITSLFITALEKLTKLSNIILNGFFLDLLSAEVIALSEPISNSISNNSMHQHIVKTQVFSSDQKPQSDQAPQQHMQRKQKTTIQTNNQNMFPDDLLASISTESGSPPPLFDLMNPFEQIEEYFPISSTHNQSLQQSEVSNNLHTASISNNKLTLELKTRTENKEVCKALLDYLANRTKSLRVSLRDYSDATFSDWMSKNSQVTRMGIMFWNKSNDMSLNAINSIEFLRQSVATLTHLEISTGVAKAFNCESMQYFCDYVVSDYSKLKSLKMPSSLFKSSMEFYKFLLCLSKSQVRHFAITGNKFEVLSDEAFLIGAWKTFVTARLRSLVIVGQKFSAQVMRGFANWKLLKFHIEELAPTPSLPIEVQLALVSNEKLVSFAHENFSQTNIAHQCFYNIQCIILQVSAFEDQFANLLHFSPFQTFWDLYLD